MNKSILTAVLSAILFSAMPVVAQAALSTDKDAPAKQTAPNVQDFDKRMTQAQESMNKMQEQMDRIRQTPDPKEQQKLLQDHWTTMQNNMELMHRMWGPGGGMGCCMDRAGMAPGMMKGGPMMGWGRMRGYYSKLTPDQLKQRQYMMDQYVPMQQMMMDHMMQHQQYMWAK